jgi:hypothetical protein
MESQALAGDERDMAFGETKPRLKRRNQASIPLNLAAPGVAERVSEIAERDKLIR